MPTRELYWNISNLHYLIYPLFVLAVIAFVYGYYRRYKIWTLGQPEKREGGAAGIKDMLLFGLGQKRVLRDAFPGVMHIFIFYGFIMLFITTLVVALQADFGVTLFQGGLYVFLKIAANLLGMLAIVGVIMAWWRRYVQASERLDNKKYDDGLVLLLIFVILVTGFVLQALRVVGTDDPYAIYSFMGYVMAPMFAGMSPEAISSLHGFLWWFHMVLAMVFIGIIPYNKLNHIFLGFANQFLRYRGPIGVPETIDFEDESLETFGKGELQEFSWKTLFNSDACIRCGRCQEICPAYASGKVLNPKGIIQEMHDYMEDYAVKLKAYKEEHATEIAEAEAAAKESGEAVPMLTAAEIGAPELIGETVSEEALWQCTTCRACEEMCPVFVEHVDKTGDMRRRLVLMESRFPAEAQLSFRNLENNGNPWGIGYATRQDFLKGEGVATLEENPDAEYLFWPGCFGAFDMRNQKVAAALVQVMNAAGVDFAIIGNDEKCCGDPARRLGNEYLFYMLATENIEVMNGYGVKKIVTQCPHCYNMLKSEYPVFGGNYEVIHHTEFLDDLINQGKLKLDKSENRSITFHDSCYLGRYNNMYNAPRDILKSVGFTDIREMHHNHDKSFCCGAGGGMMWLEEDQGDRINEMRSQEAVDCGADVLASACPYCLTMLKDGVAAKEASDQIDTLDVAEILAAKLPQQKTAEADVKEDTAVAE